MQFISIIPNILHAVTQSKIIIIIDTYMQVMDIMPTTICLINF